MAFLAMVALWSAAEPANTLEEYWNFRAGLEIISGISVSDDPFLIPASKHVCIDISQKGSSTYEFTLKALRSGS